ncbi:transcriptional regulator [Actinosynnema sp. NPDC020468]|uniref:transcriptional regulator n=1 Tax=Actinosynnema sp. NPDC020468 TaxID=3154488 RepID=UPI0033EECDFC
MTKTQRVQEPPPGEATAPQSHTIRLRFVAFAKAARLAGFYSDYALAKAMGLNRSTVTRVRAEELQPGSSFIAGALIALAPMQFDDLFEVC